MMRCVMRLTSSSGSFCIEPHRSARNRLYTRPQTPGTAVNRAFYLGDRFTRARLSSSPRSTPPGEGKVNADKTLLCLSQKQTFL